LIKLRASKRRKRAWAEWLFNKPETELNVENKMDFSQSDDSELIEMYGRLDPSRAPALSSQVKDMLIKRGFIIPDGDIGSPHEILPSREKLQKLIGVNTPIMTKVFFGDVPGIFGWLQPARNDFNLVGDGMLEADGIYLTMVGPRSGIPLAIRKTRFQHGIKLNWRRIVDVENQGNALRIGYQVPGDRDVGINVWFPNPTVAAQIADILPKTRTQQFQPQLSMEMEYQERLLSQPPKSTATLTLLVANVALFIAAALGGAGWFIPNPAIEIAAGSNLGPLTTHGEWWRLITALFVHFGLIHLLFNMWALAAFGALSERLLGIRSFIFIYFVSGITANLFSITLRPSIDTAGASGAIFGILGALLAVYWRNKRTLPFTVVRSERTAVIMFATFALLGGFLYEGVDNAAHLGGLFTGLLLGYTLSHAKQYPAANMPNRLPTLKMLLAAAAILACGFWGALHASAAHQPAVTHDSTKI
jgi:membrane associated rhomboid family serine protease